MKVRTSYLLGILVLCLLSHTATAAFEEEDGVIVITMDNFEEVIAGHTYVLCEFYAPWCQHCKDLAPEYSKAAEQLKEEGSEIRLAKVDVTANEELGRKYNIRGYPTLKLFQDGKPRDYEGGRDAASIIAWLKKKMEPPVKRLESQEEIEAFRESANIVVIAHFKNADTEAEKAFEEAAAALDVASFGIVKTGKWFGSHERELHLTNNPYNLHMESYYGDYTVEDITAFVHSKRLPLVSEFSQESAEVLFGGPRKSHVFMFLSKESPDFKSLMSEFEEAAHAFDGKLFFVYFDADTAENSQIMEYFGVAMDQVPAVRIVEFKEKVEKHEPDFTELSALNIAEFARSQLNIDVKSQDIPEITDKSKPKVLVGTNLGQVVMDETQNVFVMLYAPWSGHCKALLPVWDQLAAQYADDPTIVIAKIDGTANDTPGVRIPGFPTLKFFPAGTTKPISYDGERKIAAFDQFLREHAQNPEDVVRDHIEL